MIPLFSDACVDLVKEFEGLKLQRYLDVVNLPTIGYGHLVTDEDGPLMSVTPEEAEDLLDHDLTEAWNGVRRNVTVGLTQGQVDGLTSWVFNLGEGNLKKSTLLKLVNKRQFDDAAKEFGKWCLAGGVSVPGLVTRRAREKELFLS